MPVGRFYPNICRRTAGGGDGGSGRSDPPPPTPGRTSGESYKHIDPEPPLCLRGGRRWGPVPHIGGGSEGEMKYIGDFNPQPDPDEGPAVLLLDIWGEGTLQHLLTPTGTGK